MDNLISAVVAAILFIAFVAGLAESISALPFAIIVFGVIIMLLVDLVQSIKQGFREEREKVAQKD